jgi:hypothetical protein
MPEPTIDETLKSVRTLLREGRTTEADIQLDTLQKAIEVEAQRQKDMKPPPAAKSLAQLQLDWADAVCDILGNPPRLTNLIVEIKGKWEAHPDQ